MPDRGVRYVESTVLHCLQLLVSIINPSNQKSMIIENASHGVWDNDNT